jgi:hypothetical protein
VSARLTSGLLVSALVRRVSNEGGNAAVVAKGDATAGSILLICIEKNVRMAFRERLLGVDCGYGWAQVGPGPDADDDEVESWLARRRARDPDLWIIELDIPNAERFAAETSGDG